MSHSSQPITLDPAQMKLGAGARRLALVFAVIGVLGLGASYAMGPMAGGEATKTFFHSYLLNFMYFLSLGLGALFFVLVSHLMRAGWNVTVRRMAESIAWTLIPMVLPGLVLLFGMHELYEWSHADAVAIDPILQHKASFLDPSFFKLRFFIYFLVWGGLSWWYMRGSVRQDSNGDSRITVGLERMAPLSMIAYALTVTLASFDWLMSLNPHWFSTIYGVYYFAGSALSAFSLCAILAYRLKQQGKLGPAVNPAHFHDLGKLMFAFVVFWSYIAFSQYMLIWYANMPEETIFFELRQNPTWLFLSVMLLVGHFALPFLGLISRIPKLRPALLSLLAVWVLAIHWFDLFYLVVPNSRPDGPAFSLMDFTCFVGIGGLFLAVLIWRLAGVSLVPVKDPRLQESLELGHA